VVDAVAAEPIGSQHGALAVRDRLNRLDPAVGETAYNTFFGSTAVELIKGHNELLASVAALKQEVAALKQRPFS
jgi:hypothetical protein